MAHGGDRYRNEVRLDFSVNTNPLGIPEKVMGAVTESLSRLEFYPDPSSEALKKKLSEKLFLPINNILVGNGASELLAAVIHAFSPKKVLVTAPSFSGYRFAAAMDRAELLFCQLKEENDFMLDQTIFESLKQGPDILFLTNPNNPTGHYIDPVLLNKILDYCEEHKILTVLDECFMEISDEPEKHSLSGSVLKRPELLILRAFTKSFAAPGLRLGYMLCGDSEKAAAIGLQLPEWNISIPAGSAGEAALEETDFLEKSREYIRREREYLTEELERLGLKVFSSVTNYLLLENQDQDHELYRKLLDQGILIRDCSDYPGLGVGFYRVAVRPHEENIKLISELERLLKL